MNANIVYLDGNAAGGEISRIFAMDLTAAQGQRIAERRGASVKSRRRVEPAAGGVWTTGGPQKGNAPDTLTAQEIG